MNILILAVSVFSIISAFFMTGCGKGCGQIPSAGSADIDMSYISMPMCGGCTTSGWGCSTCLWGENCVFATISENSSEDNDYTLINCSELYYGNSCLGCGYSPEYVYNGFASGTMNGKDGKPFKTRDGGVMRLENLIAQINKAVYDKIMENRTVSEEEANNTAKIVGLAALKYGDLSNQASKDYIFDIDRFASFEGNTGPYILYTIVRIKSILEKYKAESGNADVNLPVINTDNGSQMQLMLEVAKFNEIIENAAEELAPHKICSYVYDLSNAFNRFYHETKILAEDQTKKAGYIALINLTINVLEQCIDLLGFSAPDRM